MLPSSAAPEAGGDRSHRSGRTHSVAIGHTHPYAEWSAAGRRFNLYATVQSSRSATVRTLWSDDAVFFFQCSDWSAVGPVTGFDVSSPTSPAGAGAPEGGRKTEDDFFAVSQTQGTGGERRTMPKPTAEARGVSRCHTARLEFFTCFVSAALEPLVPAGPRVLSSASPSANRAVGLYVLAANTVTSTPGLQLCRSPWPINLSNGELGQAPIPGKRL
ncbi:Hypothetical protein SMAX5B_001178 [Scophthalmus maximus]|uniref:Uncharacterized protein n=1 Tax=Scophthalmus maximus TaxID=52904 RepID=A0A2U9CBH9_SCOMX|nr:Hypothetical protein SMAX5B_001178 [Scophthalmus maximus]